MSEINPETVDQPQLKFKVELTSQIPEAFFKSLCFIFYSKDMHRTFPTATKITKHLPTANNNNLIITLFAPDSATDSITGITEIKLSEFENLKVNNTIKVLPVSVSKFSSNSSTPIHGTKPLIGKIYSTVWRNSAPETIRDHINSNYSHPIIDRVEKFKRRENGLIKYTGQYKLFFNATNLHLTLNVFTLPETISIEGRSCVVTPFVPMARGCNRCLAFGHKIAECPHTDYTCKNCGGTAPKDAEESTKQKKLVLAQHETCNTPKSCVNCLAVKLPNSQHSPFSAICPIKRKEFKIRHKAVASKIRVCDARKMLEAERLVAMGVFEEHMDNLNRQVNQNQFEIENEEAEIEDLTKTMELQKQKVQQLMAYMDGIKTATEKYDTIRTKISNQRSWMPHTFYPNPFSSLTKAIRQTMEILRSDLM